MDERQRNQDMSNTWTDELNAALEPFDILLSGVDAASILPSLTGGSLYKTLQAFTDADFAALAERANQFCETDRIQSEHIREAVRKTLWHWTDH